MAKFNDSVAGLLKEVEKFLTESLKTENLSNNGNKQRTQLLDKVINIRQEYPQLQIVEALPQPGNSPKSIPKSLSNIVITDESKERDESSFTGGSGNADDEEGAYSESIPFIAVADIVNITKAGFLEKKRKKETVLLKSYQKRYCVLKDNILYYYEKQTDKRQLGAFILKDYEVRTSPNLGKESTKKDLSFDLLCPGKRTYQFIAYTKEDLLEWKSAIEKAAIKNMITSSMIDPEEESIYEEFDDILTLKSSAANADIYDDNINEDEVYDDAEAIPVKKIEKPPVTGSPKKPSLKSSLPPVPPPRKEDPLPALPDRNPPTSRGKSDPTSSPAKSTSVVENELMDELYDDVGSDTQQFLLNNKNIEIRNDEYENIYYGQWDFLADNNSELTFKKGDLIKILSREFDARCWWIGLLDGQVGLVPKTFLTEAYDIVA